MRKGIFNGRLAGKGKRRHTVRPNPLAIRPAADVRALLPLLAAARNQSMTQVIESLVRDDARARGIEVAA